VTIGLKTMEMEMKKITMMKPACEYVFKEYLK
jgi:hypothetical protein